MLFRSKLKLAHWNQFSPTERQILLTMPCETLEESQAYREFLQALVKEKTGTPAGELPCESNPPWEDGTTIPENVRTKAAEFGLIFTLEKWQDLTPLQRFALIKLSRPSHENRNFYPALQEFGLL